MEDIDLILDMALDGMDRALKHTQIELTKISLMVFRWNIMEQCHRCHRFLQ
jgi:hypothetical protein